MFIRHTAKTALLPVARGLGLFALANAVAGGTRRVALNYHNVRPDVFERHATWLANHADVLALDEFVSTRGEPARRLTVALTFDDGYASFASRIAPVLARRRMRAAWFVTTGLVDGAQPFWFDRVQAAVVASARPRLDFAARSWTLSSWNRAYVAIQAKREIRRAPCERRDDLVEELVAAAGEPPAAALDALRLVTRDALRAVDPSLVEVGSHSRTHPQLSQLDDPGLAAEVDGSKDELERWLGRPVRHFAYPSGDHDRRVIDAVRGAGYASAWTTQPRFVAATDDVLALPRVSIDDEASVAVLSARTTPLVHRLGAVR